MSEITQLVNEIDRLKKRLVVLETTGKQRVFTAVQSITGAAVTTIFTHSSDTNTAYSYDIEVNAIRTDVAGDSATYRRLFRAKNIGGTLTIAFLLHPTTGDSSQWEREDNAAWVLATVISGTNLLIRVTGVAAQTIKWSYRATILQVS